MGQWSNGERGERERERDSPQGSSPVLLPYFAAPVPTPSRRQRPSHTSGGDASTSSSGLSHDMCARACRVPVIVMMMIVSLLREGTCMHLVQEAIDGSEVEVCKVH